MRILHTGDWHLGKKLGRIDRTDEYAAALDEVIAIARDRQVDVTVVSGDLLDRALPPLTVVRFAFEQLRRLAEASGRVVLIAGNHDSPELLDFLAPLVEPLGIHIVARPLRPNDGGVVRTPSRDGSETAAIACLPFIHEAQVVDFMQASGSWYSDYNDKIMKLSQALCSTISADEIGILAAHYFVDQAQLGGGERKVHMGPQYAVSPHSIPPSIHYAALGHVHKPQEVPGSAVRARYSGSLIQLDFGEREQDKHVVVVEAKKGQPAKAEIVPITAGRRLLRIEDSLDGLGSRAEDLKDAYLDVRVKTDGPVLGIADMVREILPNAVMVRAVWERSDIRPAAAVADRALSDVYADYFRSAVGHGSEIPREVLEAFRELEQEVSRAPA